MNRIILVMVPLFWYDKKLEQKFPRFEVSICLNSITMPSLPHYSLQTDAYALFFEAVISNKTSLQSWRSKDLTCYFIRLLVLCTIGCSFIQIPKIIVLFILYRFNSIFVSIHGEYIGITVEILVSWYPCTIILTLLFAPYSLFGINFYQIAAMSLVSNLILLLITISVTRFGNVANYSDDQICWKYFQCTYWDTQSLLNKFMTLFLILLLNCVFIYFYKLGCCCHGNNTKLKREIAKTNSPIDSDSNKEKAKKNENEKLQPLLLSVGDTDAETGITSKPVVQEQQPPPQQRQQQLSVFISNKTTKNACQDETRMKSQLKMIMVYVFTIQLFLLILNGLISNTAVSSQKTWVYESNYIALVTSCIIFGIILQLIAREIDSQRVATRPTIAKVKHWISMNNNNNWETIFEFISIELMTSLLVSSYYHAIYRFLVLFHIPSFGTFVIVKITHLFVEIVSQVLLMSVWYFDFTIKLSNYIKLWIDNSYGNLNANNNNNNTNSNCCFRCLRNFNSNKLIDDKSNITQFRNRTSFDILFNFMASVITSFWIEFAAIFVGKDFFGMTTWNEFYIGLGYNFASVFIEILYFAILVKLHLKWYQFDLVKPLTILAVAQDGGDDINNSRFGHLYQRAFVVSCVIMTILAFAAL